MSVILTLLEGAGGAAVAVLVDGDRACVGTLPPAARAALRSLGGLYRDADAERAQADALVGRLLEPGEMAPVREALARAAPDRLHVVARCADLHDLPWEILAKCSAAPLRHAEVLRLYPGTPAAGTRSAGLDLLLWCATPDDEGAASVVEALRDLARRERMLRLVEVEPGTRVPPPDRSRVLHVVTADASGMEAARSWLPSALDGVALAVLDALGGTNARWDRAAPLVEAGAPAVLTTAEPIAPAAARAMHDALYGALLAGGTVAAAAAAARHAVARALPMLSVQDSRFAADHAPVEPLALPAAVRTPGADAAAVVRRLLRGAPRGALLGVEALAAAMDDDPALDGLRRPPWAVLAAMGWRGPPMAAAFTPRLARVFASLDEGFDLVALRGALLAEHPLGQRARVQANGLTLEVVGGPEDGERVVLDPEHAVLGRWHHPEPGPGRWLYRHRHEADGRLSRKQLRFDAPGRLTNVGAHPVGLVRAPPARWGEAPPTLFASGDAIEVEPGDLLLAGARTWLEVLG